MSSKRKLKLYINNVCTELFAECMAVTLYGTDINKENVGALLSSILVIHNDYIRRVSHPEPGMKAKTFYKKLTEDFNEQVKEILDQIDNLG
ncbi:MAG: hypothetical protein SPI30_07075 [Prevotella sp.]|nr:hypothetical protein [Prevotella sp.]